jgi:hypothetical protein
MIDLIFMITDWWDGPKSGFATFHDAPHFFDGVFDELVDDYIDSYYLHPINQEILELAKEEFSIWLRWKKVFDEGKIPIDTHPALPKDRPRFEYIRSILEPAIQIDLETAIQKKARFMVTNSNLQKEYARDPDHVEWIDEGRSQIINWIVDPST